MTPAPAYIVARIQVTDWGRYGEYVKHTPRVIAQFGGRFIVRGGETTVLEGDWQPSRVVVLEFADLAAAKRWYESEAYQDARRLREGAASFNMIAVQGVE